MRNGENSSFTEADIPHRSCFRSSPPPPLHHPRAAAWCPDEGDAHRCIQWKDEAKLLREHYNMGAYVMSITETVYIKEIDSEV